MAGRPGSNCASTQRFSHNLRQPPAELSHRAGWSFRLACGLRPVSGSSPAAGQPDSSTVRQTSCPANGSRPETQLSRSVRHAACQNKRFAKYWAQQQKPKQQIINTKYKNNKKYTKISNTNQRMSNWNYSEFGWESGMRRKSISFSISVCCGAFDVIIHVY